MGLFDSLFGRSNDRVEERQPMGRQQYDVQSARPQNADEQAIARYRYMLQTAPPDELERAHAEAFERLTPQQREMVLQQISQEIPDNERGSLRDDPQSLARAATRAEIRRPGTLERTLGNAPAGGGMGGGMGMMGGIGGMMAGSLLASMAGAFIGTSIAGAFFSNPANESAFQGSPEAAAVDGGVDQYDQGAFQETGMDASSDPYGDPGGGDMTETGDFGGFDSGGFDSGGFDGGGFDI